MEGVTTLCSNCGTNNEEESVYCGSCGTRLGSSHNFLPSDEQLGRPTKLHVIPSRVLQYFRLETVTTIISKTRGFISRIQLSMQDKLRMLPIIPQRTAQVLALVKSRIPSLARTKNPQGSSQSSRLASPTKENSNIYKRVALLDKFSSLPLWFTMPLIFACSFAFGVILMLLLRGF